jgi:hypothetical protein
MRVPTIIPSKPPGERDVVRLESYVCEMIKPRLSDVALRMTAGTGCGFATVFDGVPAEIAAINFAAADRPDDRAVTGIVAAGNRSFLHGSRARRWLEGVVRDFHADNLGRWVRARKVPRVISVVKRFQHTQGRRNVLRIDRTSHAHRVREEPLPLTTSGLRGKCVEFPGRRARGRRRRWADGRENRLLSGYRKLRTGSVAVEIPRELQRSSVGQEPSRRTLAGFWRN